MNSNSKKIHWTPCTTCRGEGRILRGPSKRRRRAYKRNLEIFECNSQKSAPPEALTSNMDICLLCNGSGLVHSETHVREKSNYPHVAIIGGGIGGTALAVACMHRGIPFTLYERDISFNARSQGYGLTLQQASKAIAGLGITSLSKGVISTRHVVHDPNGQVIGEWGLRRWIKKPVPQNTKRKNIHIARQTLRKELYDQLGDSSAIRWGHNLTSISRNGDNTTNLVFKVNEEVIEQKTDLVVGADGIYSSVRRQIFNGKKDKLEYLDCIVILGICPLKLIVNVDSSLLDSATVFQTVNGHERIYVMPYDNDTVMWQLSFPLDEDQAKELHKKGAKELKKEALQRLGQWHDPVSQILMATPASLITGYPAYDRGVLNGKLLDDVGNITLIGDAAHPMSPFKGQGANQALLDALSLARMIFATYGDAHWQEKGLREIVLKTFEKSMLTRVKQKVIDSRKAAKALHTPAVLHKGDNPRGRGF